MAAYCINWHRLSSTPGFSTPFRSAPAPAYTISIGIAEKSFLVRSEREKVLMPSEFRVGTLRSVSLDFSSRRFASLGFFFIF